MTRDIAPVALIDLAAQHRRLGDSVERAMERVIEHGRFIMGPEVFEFESRLAAFCGAPEAVACASGTDALVLALLAWKVGPGDAVFVPAFTFAATAEVVALVGATPVFVDVDMATFNLDPSSLADTIGSSSAAGLQAVGVIAVDLFGQPADYDAIDKIAAEHGMWVLSDAAQSFGSTDGTRRGGTYGTVSATSFFPTKPLGGYGDGGAVFTADKELADRMRSLRVHGQGAHAYDHRHVGINGRMDTLQAAILVEKLKLFPEELKARQRIADLYSAELAQVVVTPTTRPHATSAWAQYTIQTPGRDQVAILLADEGIATAVHYPKPLHHQHAYQVHPTAPGGLHRAETLARRVLSLPMHPYLEESAQRRVIQAVRRAVTAVGTSGG